MCDPLRDIFFLDERGEVTRYEVKGIREIPNRFLSYPGSVTLTIRLKGLYIIDPAQLAGWRTERRIACVRLWERAPGHHYSRLIQRGYLCQEHFHEPGSGVLPCFLDAIDQEEHWFLQRAEGLDKTRREIGSAAMEVARAEVPPPLGLGVL